MAGDETGIRTAVEGVASRSAPYPGLRSFDRHEADVFFGRDRCLDGMAQTLQDTNFLAVLGPSGSGKSSLVRSGLFMHLEAGMAPKAGSRWTFLDIRHPRTRPFEELARLTLQDERDRRKAAESRDEPEAATGADDEGPSKAEVSRRQDELRLNPFGLVRWWSEQPHHPNENLLLLVDQFEELFGYSTPRERDEVETFIDLLLHSAASADADIYVVLTMRSEFLGGCSLFPGLAEQINKSLNLTPRMTREECEKAIVGPAYGQPLSLEPLLVTTLLNDMNSLAAFDTPADPAAQAEESGPSPTDALSQADLIAHRADQLPLMQHVLNWMWILADSKRGDEEQAIHLTHQDYLALGGLRGSLNLHANQVMLQTGDEDLTARLFRALTDQPSVATTGSAESSAVRRRRTVAALAAETGASEARVVAVVDRFRADNVSMLTPDPSVKLTSGDEVDISHESIIRQWSDLRGWIRDEAEAGRSWQELLRDEREGKELRGLDLAERGTWWDKAEPRSGWSERYGGAFDRVKDYLESSQAAERRRKRFRLAMTGALLAAGIASGISFIGTRAAAIETQADAEEAKALAARAVGLAVRDRERARWQAGRALAQANAAAAERTRARAQAALAEQTAAAAQKSAADAAQRMILANAQVASAQARSDKLTSDSRHLAVLIADSLHRPRIRTAMAEQDGPAQTAFTETQKGIEELRAFNPAIAASLAVELGKARGDRATYKLDFQGMTDAVNLMNETADGPALAGVEEGAALKSQAEVLRGRSQWLEGQDREALASFDRAISGLSGTSAESARLALADAYFERASALLGRGEERDVAAAAKDAEDCRQAVGPAPASSGAADTAADAAAADDSANRLAAARCLIVAGAAAKSDDDAAKAWQDAGLLLKDSKAERTALTLARSDLGLRYLRRFPGMNFDKVPDEIGAAIENELESFFLFGPRRQQNPGDDDREVARPLEVLQRIRLANVLVPGFLDQTEPKGDSSGDEMLASVVIADEAGRLLQKIAPTMPFQAARLSVSVSDAFASDVDNRIRLAKLQRLGNMESIGDITPGVAGAILAHLAFLSRGGAPDRTRLDALIGQALSLLEDRPVSRASAPIYVDRYGGPSSLPRVAARLATELCKAPAGSAPPERCAALKAEAAGIAAEAADRASAMSSLADRAGPVPRDAVWADSNNVALGGLDPLSCITPEGGTLGLLRAGFPDLKAASRSCTLRSGRYDQFSLWQGRIWLFESTANKESFDSVTAKTAAPASDPTEYFVQFAGSDALALGTGRLQRPSPDKDGIITAALVNDKLYLLGPGVKAEALTSELLAAAQRFWEQAGRTTPPRVAPAAAPPPAEPES